MFNRGRNRTRRCRPPLCQVPAAEQSTDAAPLAAKSPHMDPPSCDPVLPQDDYPPVQLILNDNPLLNISNSDLDIMEGSEDLFNPLEEMLDLFNPMPHHIVEVTGESNENETVRDLNITGPENQTSGNGLVDEMACDLPLGFRPLRAAEILSN